MLAFLDEMLGFSQLSMLETLALFSHCDARLRTRVLVGLAWRLPSAVVLSRGVISRGPKGVGDRLFVEWLLGRDGGALVGAAGSLGALVTFGMEVDEAGEADLPR